jgi:peptide/nickel transport system substrate-binding protein
VGNGELRRALVLRRIVLAALGIALLAACDGGAPPPPVLAMGLAQAPTTLDPRYATDAASARVCRLLYRRLVEIDERGAPVPALATWERVAPDRYLFTLRPDAPAFADGSPLTAGDVAATYESVLDPATGSPHRGALGAIARVEVLDESRVAFQLGRPDPLFPAYATIGILPAAKLAAGHDFGAAPLGNGPFTLVGRAGEARLRLRRRWDGVEVDLLEVKDPTVRALKLLRGEIHLMQNDLPPELARHLGEQPGVRLDSRPGTTFAYLGLNFEEPALADPRVREAIALALDRDAIVAALFRGLAEPGESILPPDHWAGAELPAVPHDPSRARRLVADAGFGPQRPLRLTYKTSADPFRLRLATVIQHQLRQAGIETTIRSYDWGTFYGDVKAGRFQLYSLAWVGVSTPDIFRYAFHSASLPPAGANRSRFRSGAVDALIEQAERAGDLADVAGRFRAVQAELHAARAFVPLWREHNVAVSRAEIEGYRVARDGNYDGLESIRPRSTSAGQSP